MTRTRISPSATPQHMTNRGATPLSMVAYESDSNVRATFDRPISPAVATPITTEIRLRRASAPGIPFARTSMSVTAQATRLLVAVTVSPYGNGRRSRNADHKRASLTVGPENRHLVRITAPDALANHTSIRKMIHRAWLAPWENKPLLCAGLCGGDWEIDRGRVVESGERLRSPQSAALMKRRLMLTALRAATIGMLSIKVDEKRRAMQLSGGHVRASECDRLLQSLSVRFLRITRGRHHFEAATARMSARLTS